MHRSNVFGTTRNSTPEESEIQKEASQTPLSNADAEGSTHSIMREDVRERLFNEFKDQFNDFFCEVKSWVEEDQYTNPKYCEILIKLMDLKNVLDK